MPLENLGDLVLVVGADLSSLEDTLQSVPAVAQAAGAAIDSALGTALDSATASLAKLGEAVAGLTPDAAQAAGQMDMFAESTSNAAAQLDLFTQGTLEDAKTGFSGIEQNATAAAAATESTGSAAAEAGGAFATLGEHLMEALTELGLLIGGFEALKSTMEAVATEQAFAVSMTALTGSAQTANKTLEDLRSTAQELPVALDSLLQATQRMQAFGVATEAIPEFLHAAADAAAATGQGFDTVAAGLERVQVTGTVMARSLMQMGVTWKQVATQMGVSVEEAQAAFKKGAQSAEEDVRILVDTIETNYGGLSAKLADTIGGQFQILKNQFTELASDIGALLAPLAMGQLQLISAVVQGWLGMLAVLDNLVVALERLSGHTAEQAQKEAELAAAHQLLINATNDQKFANASLEASLAAYGIVVDHAGLSVAEYGVKLVATAEQFRKMNDLVQNAATYWALFKGELQDLYPTFDAFLAAMKRDLDALKSHSTGIEDLTAKYKEHKLAVDQATIAVAAAKAALDGSAQSVAVYDAALAALKAAQQALDPAAFAAHVKALADAHKAAADAAKNHADTLTQLTDNYLKSNTTVQEAAKVLTEAQVAYDAARVTGQHLAETQAVLVAAQNQYTKALSDANPLLAKHVQSLEQMSVAYDQAQLAVQAAKVVLDQAKASYEQLTSAADNGITVIRGYGTAHAQSTSQVIAAKGALDAATGSLNTMTAAHGNVAKALALVQQAQENYTAALKEADAMAKGHGASLDSLKAKYDENKLAVDAATKTLNEAIAANDGSAKMAEVAAMAQVNLAAAVKTLDEHTKAATASVKDHTAGLHNLSTQAQETVGHFGDYSVVLGNATGATRVHVQSIQELTNHENALQAALAQARITLDAAKLGYDGSGASLAILNAAEAQFNKLLGEADPLLKQQISDMNGLAGAAKGAASAIQGAGAALDGFQSSVDRSSANVGMQELSAMFGGYQGMSAFDAITGGGAIGSHAGENVVMQDGEIISQSDVNPGTLSPVPHSQSSSVVAAVVTAVQGSLSTVADAAAVLQQIAQNDFAGAIAQLQKDGVSMQNAFTDVMDAADAMRQAGDSVQNLSTAAISSVSTTLGTFSGVAQAAMNTITSTQSAVVAATVGVMAAAMAVLPVAAAVAAPKMSVGSLNQYGVNTGLPTGAAGPYVGSGPQQSNTFNFNGPVVGGPAGVRELFNMFADQMRRAGMRF